MAHRRIKASWVLEISAPGSFRSVERFPNEGEARKAWAALEEDSRYGSIRPYNPETDGGRS